MLGSTQPFGGSGAGGPRLGPFPVPPLPSQRPPAPTLPFPGPPLAWDDMGYEAGRTSLRSGGTTRLKRPRRWGLRFAMLGMLGAFGGGVYARPMLEARYSELVKATRMSLGFGERAWSDFRGTTPVPSPAEVPSRPVVMPLGEPARPVPAAPEVVASPAAEAATQALAAQAVTAPAPTPRREERPRPVVTREPAPRHAPPVAKVANAAPVAVKPEARPEPAAPKPAPVEEAPPPVARSADPLDRLLDQAVRGKRSSKPEMVEIDRMLRKAGKGEKAEPSAEADVASGVKPATESRPSLSRTQIVAGMKAVDPEVAACAREHNVNDTADLTVTVSPDGAVTGVKLAGPLFATRAGGCVVKAVRAASFPASSGLTFPYRLTVR